jgi:ATP-dependent exoDNAse (exonuclease V) beta subunit
MADVLPFPLLPVSEVSELADSGARQCALDIRRSFIVEAPAGSGKTGLLIQRFLKLLADPNVTAPEQVLAITFTKKATAEMRNRVLGQLEAAARSAPVSEPEFDYETRNLAGAVLERDRQLGWSLLTQPERLRIRTIDSLCAEIARMLPVLSGSGGRLSPTEQAQPLYHEAARRTILLLGGNHGALHESIREVLLHRDGNVADCEQLIADMLGLREQWGELIWGMVPVEQRQILDYGYLDTHVLPRLEAAMDEAICAALEEVHREFPPDLLEELVSATAILTNISDPRALNKGIAACAGRMQGPRSCSEDLGFWQALIYALIPPSQKSWRKSFDTRALGQQPDPAAKASLLRLISRLDGRDDLLTLLLDLRDMPPARYPENQWRVAKALFHVLNRAMVELQLVFVERNQCDFTELSLLASHALSQSSGAEDFAEVAGSRLQHLLVDEMQDTSSSQYHLLEVLTRSWDGSSQTAFLVGDPRQSIYLFRQARVERFLQAVRELCLGELPLEHLKLTSNFRSQRALVQSLNQQFSAIFPHYSDALPYSNAEAVLPASEFAAGLEWHAHIIPNASKTTIPSLAELQQQRRRTDAREIARLAQEWFAKPLPEGRRNIRTSLGEEAAEPWRIAVLVRSRNHLGEIIPALREAAVPYRALNIEVLNERQEILDLTALTRSLLHPADRVAGLAVLRAPWCGLALVDLHRITGADDPLLKDLSILRLLAERGGLLGPQARERAGRVQSVLAKAALQRGRLTTAQLVEKTWRTLGGDVLLSTSELANTDRFFQLVATLEKDSEGSEVSLTALESRLRELFAESDIIAPEKPHVELLTIHKAKGLEWDVVIVPGLERLPDPGRPRLLTWTTLDTGGDEGSASVMLAPIAARGSDSDSLTKWLTSLHLKRELAEHKRLFYVACTRARQELHLFAAPVEGSKGEVKPKITTLLKTAWPAARQYFQQPTLPALRRLVEEDESLELAATGAAVNPAARLKRLPASFDPTARFIDSQGKWLPHGATEDIRATRGLVERPDGSFAARAFGNVVHSALELLARRMAQEASAADLQDEVRGWTVRISAMLRGDGLPKETVDQLAREALNILQRVMSDANGLWILTSHPAAASEFSLTTASTAGVSTVRADRIFKAGPTPTALGNDYLWIVDYKTSSHGNSDLNAFLERQRQAYAAQLETYARVLAPAFSMEAPQVRVGLYFPALPRLLWWDPANFGT